ncbi:hypothetical protein ODZ57_08545, partial [Escherichia coli]|nr:hypothetical protein [Escherichia coli]
TSIICSPMTSLKTSIKTITYLSDIGCLEIQGASLYSNVAFSLKLSHLQHAGSTLANFLVIFSYLDV